MKPAVQARVTPAPLAWLGQRLFQCRGGERRHDDGRPAQTRLHRGDHERKGSLLSSSAQAIARPVSGPSIMIQGTIGRGARRAALAAAKCRGPEYDEAIGSVLGRFLWSATQSPTSVVTMTRSPEFRRWHSGIRSSSLESILDVGRESREGVEQGRRAILGRSHRPDESSTRPERAQPRPLDGSSLRRSSRRP